MTFYSSPKSRGAGEWGCFAGIFEECWRDLGGKKRINKIKEKTY